MSGLTSIDAVYIALVFIVPGYIFLSLRNQFVVGQDKLGTEQILSFLTLSGLNFALFGWVIFLAYAYQYGAVAKAALWGLLIVVIPAVAGVFCGACNQRDLVRRAYHLFGLTPLHTIPRAWDYKFSKSQGEWVLVTLKSGTQFAGWWAGSSFASSDPKERDLLIEAIFEVPDDGSAWKPTGKSALIMAGEIRSVEFWPHTNGDENERKQ